MEDNGFPREFDGVLADVCRGRTALQRRYVIWVQVDSFRVSATSALSTAGVSPLMVEMPSMASGVRLCASSIDKIVILEIAGDFFFRPLSGDPQ